MWAATHARLSNEQVRVPGTWLFAFGTEGKVGRDSHHVDIAHFDDRNNFCQKSQSRDRCKSMMLRRCKQARRAPFTQPYAREIISPTLAPAMRIPRISSLATSPSGIWQATRSQVPIRRLRDSGTGLVAARFDFGSKVSSNKTDGPSRPIDVFLWRVNTLKGRSLKICLQTGRSNEYLCV